MSFQVKKHELKNISDVKMINESLNQMTSCPKCGGSDEKCNFCHGFGEVTKLKAQNYNKK